VALYQPFQVRVLLRLKSYRCCSTGVWTLQNHDNDCVLRIEALEIRLLYRAVLLLMAKSLRLEVHVEILKMG